MKKKRNCHHLNPLSMMKKKKKFNLLFLFGVLLLSTSRMIIWFWFLCTLGIHCLKLVFWLIYNWLKT